MKEEFFNYRFHGFNVYQELYCVIDVKNFRKIYKLTWISVASFRDIMEFYNCDERHNIFKDLRMLDNCS